MRFLLDMNVPASLAASLAAQGHGASHAQGVGHPPNLAAYRPALHAVPSPRASGSRCGLPAFARSGYSLSMRRLVFSDSELEDCCLFGAEALKQWFQRRVGFRIVARCRKPR